MAWKDLCEAIDKVWFKPVDVRMLAVLAELEEQGKPMREATQEEIARRYGIPGGMPRYRAGWYKGRRGRARSLPARDQLGGGVVDPEAFYRIARAQRETFRLAWKSTAKYGRRSPIESTFASFNASFGGAARAIRQKHAMHEAAFKTDPQHDGCSTLASLRGRSGAFWEGAVSRHHRTDSIGMPMSRTSFSHAACALAMLSFRCAGLIERTLSKRSSFGRLEPLAT